VVWNLPEMETPMSNITIEINEKPVEVAAGSTLIEYIEEVMPRAKNGIIAAMNGESIIDLVTPLEGGEKVTWIKPDSDEGLKVLRHSTSHVMAQAVLKLFPGTKIAIGPSTADGFYYDFDAEHRFSSEDFEKIEKEMQAIVDADEAFARSAISSEDALKKFTSEDEKYKLELIENLGDEQLTLYTNGSFTDLCRGPHVPSTGYIKAFKLMKVAGAYWRGDEHNQMLQRIYGTSFADNKSLKKYLNFLEEASRRDHRKIGKEMNLFAFYPEGPGFPFWKPNGMRLYNAIVDYWRAIHTEHGYDEVKTPIILNEALWHQSGHWDNYKENMYFTEIDNSDFAVKPMNCPGGLLIFNDGIHSYRELPMKIAELGLVHRHEKSGVLHGLFRVRQFTQDDAHIYCTKEQVKDEVKKVITLIQQIYNDFGFDSVNLELSTRPGKAIGSDEIWEIAEKALADSLSELNLEYELNPGDGAFYGPKIDFHIQDAIGRSWQCGTIQLDFSMPERFDISYVGADGNKHRPVMLHRAILGSIERFIGILIENYSGKFPFWLSPEQVRVLPIAETHFDYAFEVKNGLQKSGFRVSIDDSNETLGGKIKQARLERVSHLLIIGDKECADRVVTVRKADKNENSEFPLTDLHDFFRHLSDSKK
jgi:threonyl-tRNA synthetase